LAAPEPAIVKVLSTVYLTNTIIWSSRARDSNLKKNWKGRDQQSRIRGRQKGVRWEAPMPVRLVYTKAVTKSKGLSLFYMPSRLENPPRSLTRYSAKKRPIELES